MIVRIWVTEIDRARSTDYETFAETVSLPMFRAEPGFLGVMFARHAASRAVITLWDSMAAAAALATSPRYEETTRRIEGTGILVGQPTIVVWETHGGWVRPAALVAMAGADRAGVESFGADPDEPDVRPAGREG